MIDPGLLSVIILSLVHLFANRPKILGWVWHKQFLSVASGISLTYVFIDLLPSIQHGQPILKQAIGPVLSYFELHTYLIALLGILFYYGISTQTEEIKKNVNNHPWARISGYLLFNFLIGASLADSANPEIQPLTLFTLAIALDCFIRDHVSHVSKSPQIVWALIASLFSGYCISDFYHIPEAITAVGVSFSAGGILLNVFHYELPQKNRSGYKWFVAGSLIYAAILLSIGIV